MDSATRGTCVSQCSRTVKFIERSYGVQTIQSPFGNTTRFRIVPVPNNTDWNMGCVADTQEAKTILPEAEATLSRSGTLLSRRLPIRECDISTTPNNISRRQSPGLMFCVFSFVQKLLQCLKEHTPNTTSGFFRSSNEVENNITKQNKITIYR